MNLKAEMKVEGVWYKSMQYRRYQWPIGTGEKIKVAYSFLGQSYRTKFDVERAIDNYWNRENRGLITPRKRKNTV